MGWELSGHGGGRDLPGHAEAGENPHTAVLGDTVEEEFVADPVALDHAAEDAHAGAEDQRGSGGYVAIRHVRPRGMQRP